MNIIYAALSLGLLTGFHCIGMCGPIAIALPLNKKSWGTRILSALWYNVGRTITYALMGVLFGIVGAGFSFAGFQKWVSIVMGSFMIASVLFPKINHLLYRGTGDSRIMNSVKRQLAKYFQQASYKALFITGLLNGLLPCGMVYMALAGAIAVGSLGGSVLFMILFGLGTIPMMFLLSMLGNFASLKLKHAINKIIPVVVVVVGLIFILRGLELGIKFISPPAKKLQINQSPKPMSMSSNTFVLNSLERIID
jgi:sulfite exporter TauE/SafE